MNDGQALIVQEEDEDCKNKEPLQGEEQKMLQVGDEMEEDEQKENDKENSEQRSGFSGCSSVSGCRLWGHMSKFNKLFSGLD